MSWKKAGRALAKGTAIALKTTGKIADEGKRLAEPAIDKYLALIAANAGLLYGAAEIIDRNDYSDPTNFMIAMGTGVVFTIGNYAALFSPRTRVTRASIASLNKDIDRNRYASWIKSLALAGSIWYAGAELHPYFQQVRQDLFPKVRDPPLVSVEKPRVPEVTRERPKSYETLGHTTGVTYDFTGTKLADKNSMTGRIQRTMRWQPIYRAIEINHGLPNDTLAGMIMQESYGDPVQPNASDDGGLRSE